MSLLTLLAAAAESNTVSPAQWQCAVVDAQRKVQKFVLQTNALGEPVGIQADEGDFKSASAIRLERRSKPADARLKISSGSGIFIVTLVNRSLANVPKSVFIQKELTGWPYLEIAMNGLCRFDKSIQSVPLIQSVSFEDGYNLNSMEVVKKNFRITVGYSSVCHLVEEDFSLKERNIEFSFEPVRARLKVLEIFDSANPEHKLEIRGSQAFGYFTWINKKSDRYRGNVFYAASYFDSVKYDFLKYKVNIAYQIRYSRNGFSSRIDIIDKTNGPYTILASGMCDPMNAERLFSDIDLYSQQTLDEVDKNDLSPH